MFIFEALDHMEDRDMSTIDDSTYHCRETNTVGHDAYVLSPEVAEGLRVPKIQYPENKIPVSVARKCLPKVKGCTLSCARLQDPKGSVLMADVMDLMDQAMTTNGLVCASCQTSCEYAQKNQCVA